MENLQNYFNNIRIVLVNTSHPGNIGATARAMKNMGLRDLHLVAPHDFPSGVATGRAVSATDILDNAVVTERLEDSIADCGIVIGASARARSIPWPLLSPPECAQQVVESCGNNKVALVFGREDSGLTNEELQLCHFHVNIPADDEYSSLNLAAAVMVISYEVRMALLAHLDAPHKPRKTGGLQTASSTDPDVEKDNWDVPRATAGQLENFYQHFEQVMVDLNFHDRENPRLLMMRMRRLFGRIIPDQMEISILRGFLAHVDMLNERATRGITVEQQRGERRAAKVAEAAGSLAASSEVDPGAGPETGPERSPGDGTAA